MLPADWQARVVEMIRGAAPLDGAWFRGSAALSPEEQIGVYREQFTLRLTEALDAELAGLRGLLGDGLDGLFEAYLLDHPPRSWSLDHAADRFPAWLEAQEAPAEQVEMARLDLAVSALFLAADAPVASPADLSAGRPLTLAPSTRRLRLGWDVHRHRSETLQGRPAPAPRPGDWRLLLYRTEDGPRHWELDPATDAALGAFARGCTVEEAVDAALTEAPEAAPTLGALFREIAARRVLCPLGLDMPRS